MKRVCALLILLMVGVLESQTVRPSHWMMDELRFQWNRGNLWDLSTLHRPFSTPELYAAFQNMGEPQSSPLMQLLRRATADDSTESVLFRIELDNALARNNGRTLLHTVHRVGAGVRLNSNVLLFGAFNIDNQLDADSMYIGERQSGFAAFMEQAYIRTNWKSFQIKFGRDYLTWGPGLDASLHLSDASRPLDHLYLSWQNRLLHLSYFSATLDATDYNIKGEASKQNRYLSGHRIEFRPGKYFRCGLAETALFSSPDAGLDFAYLNPVQFYTATEQNGPQTANVMASLDATLLLHRRLTLYGEFLVDDFQFESSSVDDRGEPSEYGFMAGINWAEPAGLKAVDVFSEYTRVTNRTYNGQGGPWEKYLHRNSPIGHFLGNDFDRFIFGLGYRPSPTFRLHLLYEHRRQGEGRIEKTFDMPWRDIGPGESYSEPFPTGVVESTNLMRAVCRWQPFFWLRADATLAHYSVDNYENLRFNSNDFWQASLSLSFEFAGSVPFF